jgi:hypothetical protein
VNWLTYEPIEDEVRGIELIHICPEFGKEHMLDELCWCQPELDYKDEDNGGEVWVHNVAH